MAAVYVLPSTIYFISIPPTAPIRGEKQHKTAIASHLKSLWTEGTSVFLTQEVFWRLFHFIIGQKAGLKSGTNVFL